ncbi:MAG: hypothetical protein GY874_12225 [Desulfobacteraceae bacterium]|nr:hypothetical protein [Desulfobacteraceae bacterium]
MDEIIIKLRDWLLNISAGCFLVGVVEKLFSFELNTCEWGTFLLLLIAAIFAILSSYCLGIWEKVRSNGI